MKMLLLTGGLFLLLLTPSLASAQALTGETITTTYYFPDLSSVYYLGPATDTVVPGGISNFADFADITFSSNNILITTNRNAGINAVSFDGFVFYDPNGIFASVTLDPSTNYAGFDASRLTFNADKIFVNVADLAGLSGQTISLDINTPEPETLLLFASGLLVILGRKLMISLARP